MSDFAHAAHRLSAVAAALGWTPDTFWRATPAELAAALGGMGGTADIPADAGMLTRLREQYPEG